MPPIISIIIPHYNHVRSLPRMLESIQAQSISNELDVIVVDDCSNESCADIIEAYQNKNLSVRLITNTVRQYTKNCRLVGVEAARANIIAFADADDVLLDTSMMEYHLRLMLHEQADIVAFNGALLTQDYQYKYICRWARPLAPRLRGQEIFEKYVCNNVESALMWNKLYSRELWIKIADKAKESQIRRYREDLFLTSLLFFHAQNYVGSERVGYGYRWEKKDILKAPGRAASEYWMLQNLVPYLRQAGCPETTANLFATILRRDLAANVHKLLAHVTLNDQLDISEKTLGTLSDHADSHTFLKIILLGKALEYEKSVLALNRSKKSMRDSGAMKLGKKVYKKLRELVRK